MKKVGLVSIYTGYNYGTVLQAYAMNEFIRQMGYEPYMMWYKDSLVKGRDVRISKILNMFWRTTFRPKLFKKTFFTYSNSLKREMTVKTKDLFNDFINEQFDVHKIRYIQAKKISRSINMTAVVSGSAQVWNAEAVYVSKMFYLRFAPKNKRIAYAPSMGKDVIPSYNKRLLRKYISEIPYVSVRELQGAKMIEELIGVKPFVALDPTLVVDANTWRAKFPSTNAIKDDHQRYMLLYFLDEPSKHVIEQINSIAKHYKGKIMAFPYAFDSMSNINNIEFIDAGPAEFVELIDRADYMFTDSFHGVAFAVNLNTPFFAFERNYGVATSQSSRIISILSIIGLEDCYLKAGETFQQEQISFDFESVNKKLDIERKKSIQFFRESLRMIERGN
jgi:hypothetical protein